MKTLYIFFIQWFQLDVDKLGSLSSVQTALVYSNTVHKAMCFNCTVCCLTGSASVAQKALCFNCIVCSLTGSASVAQTEVVETAASVLIISGAIHEHAAFVSEIKPLYYCTT